MNIMLLKAITMGMLLSCIVGVFYMRKRSRFGSMLLMLDSLYLLWVYLSL